MLLQKNKALQEKQGQLEELQLNLNTNQEALQKTMADLEKEKTERVQVLSELSAREEELNKVLCAANELTTADLMKLREMVTAELVRREMSNRAAPVVRRPARREDF